MKLVWASFVLFIGCGLPAEPQKEKRATTMTIADITAEVEWRQGPVAGKENIIRVSLRQDQKAYESQTWVIDNQSFPLLARLRLYSEATCCKTRREAKPVSLGRGIYEFKGEFLLGMPRSRVWIVIEDERGQPARLLYDETIDVR